MSDGTFWLMIGALSVGIAGVFVYVLFMIFLPEWVGITGKSALDAESKHRGGEEAEEGSFWKMMDAEPVKRPSAAQDVDKKKTD